MVNNISNQIVENPKITTTELALSQPEIKSIITSTPEEIKSLQASIEKQKNDGVISNKDAQLTIDAIKEVMNIKKSRFATITNVDKQAEGIGIQSSINKLKVEVSDLENQVLTGDGVDILEGKKAEIESLEKQLDDFKNFREEPAVEVKEEVVTEEVVEETPTTEVTEEVVIRPTDSSNPSFEKGSMQTFTVDGGVLEIGKVKGGKLFQILRLNVDENQRRKGKAESLLKKL